jgi:hypothetical protein
MFSANKSSIEYTFLKKLSSFGVGVKAAIKDAMVTIALQIIINFKIVIFSPKIKISH